MKITSEVLQKIENKLWERLKTLNKNEKQLIEDRNISYYSMSEFADSHGYINCMNLLEEMKEIANDNKGYIQHYELTEFETEEEKEEHKIRKAIETLKKEYQNDLDDLLTESIPDSEGLHRAQLLATAHYLESGIDTLNILEQKLED